MKKNFMFTAKAGWLLSGLTAAMLASCSQESVEPVQNVDAPGTVRITMALPGGGDVVYNPTRAIHTEEEWKINDLMLVDFKKNADGEWIIFNGFTVDNLTPVGNGEYTLSFAEPSDEIGEQHKFAFFANSYHGESIGSGDLSHFKDVNECDFYNFTLWEVMENGTINASKFVENGIVMSGTATDAKGSAQTVLTVTNGTINCHVEMTRIVGRVDLYSNAPNLVVTGATMRNAANTGHSIPADFTGEILYPEDFTNELTIGFNTNMTDSLADPANVYTSDEFAAKQGYQSYPDNGVRKAFYMYPQENREGDCLEVAVEYMLRDGSKGVVTVPFIKEDKTTGAKTYVDVERNHLYKIVLGNGEEIKNGSEVTAEIIDEPWNVVDLPAVVDKVEPKLEMEITDSEISGRKDVSVYIPEGMTVEEWKNAHSEEILISNVGVLKIKTASGYISNDDLVTLVGYFRSGYAGQGAKIVDLSSLSRLEDASSVYFASGTQRVIFPNSVKKIPYMESSLSDYQFYGIQFNLPKSLESADAQLNGEGGNFSGSSDEYYSIVIDFRGLTVEPSYNLSQNSINATYVIVREGSSCMTWKSEYTQDSIKKIYVPSDMVETYKNDSDWSAVAEKIASVDEYSIDFATLTNPLLLKVWDDPAEFAATDLWSPW